MVTTIRAHYDGKVIVLDEPVELPINQSLELEWRGERQHVSEAATPQADKEERLAAFAELTRWIESQPPWPVLSHEALRRESIYGED